MFIPIPGPLTAGQHSLVHNDNGWSSQVPRHSLPASVQYHKRDLLRNESSSENTSTQGKRHNSNHIRRPANSFILFRKDFVATRPPDFNSEGKTLSKLAGEAWGNLPSSQKRKWIDAAKEESEEHAKAHPDWKYSPTPRSTKSRRQRGVRRASPYPSPGDRTFIQLSPDASSPPKRARISAEGPSNYRTPVSVPQPAPNRPYAPQPSEDLRTPCTNATIIATPLLPEDICSQRSSVPVTQIESEQGHRPHTGYLYATYGQEEYANPLSEPSFPSSSVPSVFPAPSSSRAEISLYPHSLYDRQPRITRCASMQVPAINWDMIRVPMRDDSISPYSALDSQLALTPPDIGPSMFPYPSSSTKFGDFEPPNRTLDEATAFLEGGSTIGFDLPSMLYPFGDESLYPSGTESSTHINKFLSDFGQHVERQSENVENYDPDDHIIERYHVNTSDNTLSLFASTTTKDTEGCNPDLR